MDSYVKDTGETLRVTFDFTTKLAAAETISSVTAVAQYESGSVTTDLTVGATAIATPLVTVLLSAGVARKIYDVECKVATSGNQSLVQSVTLAVEP